MFKSLKKILFWVIILLFLLLAFYLGYIVYIDTHAAEAKEYLIDKYNFNEKELDAKGYQEYIYEDIADCESLWVKKCTSDKNLLYKYKFVLNDEVEIVVSEDKNNNYTDNYEKN